jgi:hypothetical protein
MRTAWIVTAALTGIFVAAADAAAQSTDSSPQRVVVPIP